ncbi:hypothetical protein K0M31_005125, partial [Melipona bicolor]
CVGGGGERVSRPRDRSSYHRRCLSVEEHIHRDYPINERDRRRNFSRDIVVPPSTSTDLGTSAPQPERGNFPVKKRAQEPVLFFPGTCSRPVDETYECAPVCVLCQ